MINFPDHPDIRWIERTGYPSWMQEESEYEEECDEDQAYEEKRDQL